MESETYSFENDGKNIIYRTIPSTNTSMEHYNEIKKMFDEVDKTYGLVKYHKVKRIHHSQFYEQQLHHDTGNFRFYRRLKNIGLSPLQLTFMMLYSSDMLVKDVMDVFGKGATWTKENNSEICRLIGIKKIKDLFPKN